MHEAPDITSRISVRAEELAALTGMDANHVRRLVRLGVIPRMGSTGKPVVIPASAVRNWLATGSWTEATDEPNEAA
ncbi:MAG: helix-turn-helix domain-containing protein [Acidimicrobiales bacterium]